MSECWKCGTDLRETPPKSDSVVAGVFWCRSCGAHEPEATVE